LSNLKPTLTILPSVLPASASSSPSQVLPAAWRPFVRALVAAASGVEVWRIHSWELPVVRLLILNGCFKEQFLGMARTSALQHFY
jgi:hypothetical protein